MPELTSAYLDTILTVAAYMTIITIGQYISMSSGILSTASAAWAGVGGYAGGTISLRAGTPLIVAMLIGFAVTGAMGVCLGFLTVRVAPLVAGLMTLGFAESMVVIADNINYIGGANGLSGVPVDTTLTWALVTLAATVFIGWRYDNSRLGIAARAVRDDVVGAEATGVRISWVKTSTFALGAAVAGVGGVLQVHYVSFQAPDDMGFVQGTNYLLFAVFGGSYTIWGALAGGVLLNLLPEFLRFSITSRYILYGLLLTVMVILRPEGLITRRTLSSARAAITRIRRRRGGRHKNAESARETVSAASSEPP